ncbi:9242_t:CDS:2, partial [Funneliformis caledonium]
DAIDQLAIDLTRDQNNNIKKDLNVSYNFRIKKSFSSNNNNTENIDLTNNTTILDNEKEEEDYFEESDNNIDEIVNPITYHRININQPIFTEGIINQ